MSKTREAPIAVTIENGRLVPADPWAAEELEKLPRGARFNCYLTLAKSDPDDEHGRLLTKYMAGIGQLFDWLPNTGPGTDFPTTTQLRRHILREINFCTSWPQRDGSVKKEALSMGRDHLSFEDLQICLELTRLYVGAWTEHLTGTRYEPWEEWELAHPPENKNAP